jgi:cephalosporin hydroxylase
MDFREAFSKYPTDKPKYADFYQRYIGHLDLKLILEIGVLAGGSLKAFRELFPNGQVFGIDIDPKTEQFGGVFLGDQRDRTFLNQVIDKIGIPDLIIDDGGHHRSQQIDSFLILYPKMKSGGIYIVEDLETSFLQDFNDSAMSCMDVLTRFVYPTGYSEPLSWEQRDSFKYGYTTITFERNICMVTK